MWLYSRILKKPWTARITKTEVLKGELFVIKKGTACYLNTLCDAKNINCKIDIGRQQRSRKEVVLAQKHHTMDIQTMIDIAKNRKVMKNVIAANIHFIRKKKNMVTQKSLLAVYSVHLYVFRLLYPLTFHYIQIVPTYRAGCC